MFKNSIQINLIFTQSDRFFVKMTYFSSIWRIFMLGGSAKLTEGSAEPVRPKIADGSAEPARFGRTLVERKSQSF